MPDVPDMINMGDVPDMTDMIDVTDMTAYPVSFQPIPVERIWGGDKMKTWFHADHIEAPIGEYWLVSGHPSATSVVENGPLAGLTLSELTARYPRSYLGHSPQPRFPLLVKLIEAHGDLSVQVHPNDDYAHRKEQDFGKTEAWYVLDVSPDGKVVYGNTFRNREAFLKAVKERKLQEGLAYRRVKPGDLVYVPAGTLHALLAHTTVIEVQQTSDLTYRVYDWDRVDSQGNPRQLHVQQAAEVLQFNGTEDEAVKSVVLESRADYQRLQLVQSPYFTMEKLVIRKGSTVRLPVHDGPSVIVGLSGKGSVNWQGGFMGDVFTGKSWLTPASLDVAAELAAEEDSFSDLTALRIIYA